MNTQHSLEESGQVNFKNENIFLEHEKLLIRLAFKNAASKFGLQLSNESSKYVKNSSSQDQHELRNSVQLALNQKPDKIIGHLKWIKNADSKWVPLESTVKNHVNERGDYFSYYYRKNSLIEDGFARNNEIESNTSLKSLIKIEKSLSRLVDSTAKKSSSDSMLCSTNNQTKTYGDRTEFESEQDLTSLSQSLTSLNHKQMSTLTARSVSNYTIESSEES